MVLHVVMRIITSDVFGSLMHGWDDNKNSPCVSIWNFIGMYIHPFYWLMQQGFFIYAGFCLLWTWICRPIAMLFIRNHFVLYFAWFSICFWSAVLLHATVYPWSFRVWIQHRNSYDPAFSLALAIVGQISMQSLQYRIKRSAMVGLLFLFSSPPGNHSGSIVN